MPRSTLRRRGQRKIQEGERLAATPAGADGDKLLASIQIDALDGDADAKHYRPERRRQVLVDHREPARDLLRLGVGIYRCLLDHLLEPRLADAGQPLVLASPGSHVSYSTSSSPGSSNPIRPSYHAPPTRASDDCGRACE